MKFVAAPLSGKFVMTSLIGIIISMSMFNSYPSYALAFLLVFVMMFIAGLISMHYSPLGSYDLKEEGILKRKEKE
ncbi:hypothetical protein H6504_03170 [Candidatus Woesearchaeota archaeon]|nr:hypothetical protein [Candidatus Woesearchaeota archaeon]